MRKVISISVSEEQEKMIREDMKRAGYDSTSEFFRALYREWKRGEEVLNAIKEGKKEYLKGGALEFASVRDIVKLYDSEDS